MRCLHHGARDQIQGRTGWKGELKYQKPVWTVETQSTAVPINKASFNNGKACWSSILYPLDLGSRLFGHLSSAVMSSRCKEAVNSISYSHTTSLLRLVYYPLLPYSCTAYGVATDLIRQSKMVFDNNSGCLGLQI